MSVAPSHARNTEAAEQATEALIHAVALCRKVAKEDHKAANHFVGIWSDQSLRLNFAMLDALHGPCRDKYDEEEQAA